MRRTLIFYAAALAVCSGIAFRGLITISEELIKYWRWVNPEVVDLPILTTTAPTIARFGLVLSVLLLALGIAALIRRPFSERFLIHGIAITALAQAVIVAFVIAAGMMPAMVTITELTNN